MRTLCLLIFLLAALPAKACELALLLAVDVSGSVDRGEYNVQMQGLADAIRDGSVSEALVRAEAEVALLQWTGASRQKISLPWVKIRDFDDVDALAVNIESAPRVWRNFSTAIGEAIETAIGVFTTRAHCMRKIVDISGDGMSNEGIAPYELRARLTEAGITVNALAIEASDKGLTDYFYAEVIHGPGAFAVRAADFQEYPSRIRMKLLREITEQLSGASYGKHLVICDHAKQVSDHILPCYR